MIHTMRGVGYVLKSLPENARNLFRILVAEQLALADVEGGGHDDHETPGAATPAYSDIDSDSILGASDEETALHQQASPTRRVRCKGRPAKARKPRAPPKPIASAVVAEGVESPAQRTLLRQLGCDEMQGYLIAPALPASQVAALLREPAMVNEALA